MTEIVMNQAELAAEIAARLREEVAAAVKAQNVGVATSAPAAEDERIVRRLLEVRCAQRRSALARSLQEQQSARRNFRRGRRVSGADAV
jgi:hypothetical protein